MNTIVCDERLSELTDYTFNWFSFLLTDLPTQVSGVSNIKLCVMGIYQFIADYTFNRFCFLLADSSHSNEYYCVRRDDQFIDYTFK